MCKDFKGCKVMDFFTSWEGCMSSEHIRTIISARGKMGLAAIGGVLCDSTIVFSKSVGLRDANEAELLVIRRALTLWTSFG